MTSVKRTPAELGTCDGAAYAMRKLRSQGHVSLLTIARESGNGFHKRLERGYLTIPDVVEYAQAFQSEAVRVLTGE